MSYKNETIYGCKIQNTKVGSMPILLIQEKPIAIFAIIQTQRNVVNLIAKSTQTRLKNFLPCSYTQLAQSFELELL